LVHSRSSSSSLSESPPRSSNELLLILNSDWIALNVLRAVALSTNSVAASVEPVIQQQFFTLSPPMGSGPDYGVTGMGGNVIMDHTPAHSILATLDGGSYAADSSFSGSSLDGSASSYVGSSAFGSLDAMNFMDHQGHHSVGHGGVDMTFGDSSFDVNSFAQEFVMTGTPSGGEGDSVGSVKDEAQVVS